MKSLQTVSRCIPARCLNREIQLKAHPKVIFTQHLCKGPRGLLNNSTSGFHLHEDGVVALRHDGAVEGAADVAQQLLVALRGATGEEAAAVDGAQCCDALAARVQLPEPCAQNKGEIKWCTCYIVCSCPAILVHQKSPSIPQPDSLLLCAS